MSLPPTANSPPPPSTASDADGAAAGFATPPLPTADAAGDWRPAAERYAVARLHAEGGLGQVYVARDAALNREVALKRVRPDRAGTPGGRRLLREAQVSAQLEHPNIVPVYDVGAEAGAPFYVMRLVRGQTLQAAVAEYHARRRAGTADPLDRPRLLGVFVAVCQAVAYAHSRGVLHRDLKPANVILGPFGEVQVLDWGLAKRVGAADDADDPSGVTVSAAAAGETLPGSVVGTPGYLPPEQVGGSADARSDVYGLGAVLFEVLTGRPPHAGASLAEVLQATRRPAAPRARAVDPTVPRPLDAVCTKALEPDPADRYPSAAELAEDVQRFLADEPVSAWPEPVLARARRWAGRHRALVGTAAAATAAIALLLAVATLLLRSAYGREAAARADADRHAAEARAERDRAAANYETARRAVEQYLDRVTDSPELKARGLERLRRDLLQTAVEFQKELIGRGGDDPALRADRGRAFWRLGSITRDLGDPAGALELLHSAREIQEDVTRERPDEPGPREDLARTWNQLGNVAADLGRLADAEASYDRARSMRHELTAAHADRPDLRADLAATNSNLGNLYRLTGRWGPAERAYEAAVDGFGALVKTAPDGVRYRHGLALALSNLGALQTDTARPGPALATHDRAAGEWSALVRLAPDVPEYQLGQAGGHLNRGLALLAAGQAAEAEAADRAAITLLKALADGHPGVGDYRSALAMAWGNLGVVLAGTRRAEARAARTTALDLLTRLTDEYPDVLEYRRALAAAHGNLGTFLADEDPAAAKAALDRAVALREELAKAHPDVPAVQAELADALNNLAAADVVGPAAAVDHLNRAIGIRQALAARFPNVPEYAAAEARARTTLGAVHVVAGRWDDARRALDGAEPVLARLAADYAAVAEYRHDLAAAHLNRGILALRMNQPDRAEAALLKARGLWAELGKERPADPRFPDQFARAASLLAPVHRERGPLGVAAAEADYRDATGAWERLAAAYPDTARYQVALGGAYYGLGSLNALNRLRPADALPWYDKAAAVLRPAADRDGPGSAAAAQLHLVHFGRAVAFGFLKRPEEGLRAWDEALKLATGATRSGTVTARNGALAAYADHL
ncbi:MAG TPA: serine/threonine-protein kinase, partial [Gemmataceae bacterium]|nr:serine/threonine-protein kinase [Gemmataceae bacterium]